MKKKQRITLIIIVIIVGIGTTYFLFYKQSGKSRCQDFIDECYKRNFEFWARGGHAFNVYSDGSTTLDDKADCPQKYSRYTEERGYFKDKKKQQEYYDNAIKECEMEYEICLENTNGKQGTECHKCDKYGQPIYHWN